MTAKRPQSNAANVMTGTMAAAEVLVVDDVTMIGIIDDSAIPFLIAGGAIIAGGVWLYDNFSKPTPPTEIDSQTYNPPPKELPSFPGATKVKPKGGRARWHLPDGGIGEWDSQHGELEVYDKSGKNHKGAFNPKTGQKKKDGDPSRKTEPK